MHDRYSDEDSEEDEEERKKMRHYFSYVPKGMNKRAACEKGTHDIRKCVGCAYLAIRTRLEKDAKSIHPIVLGEPHKFDRYWVIRAHELRVGDYYDMQLTVGSMPGETFGLGGLRYRSEGKTKLTPHVSDTFLEASGYMNSNTRECFLKRWDTIEEVMVELRLLAKVYVALHKDGLDGTAEEVPVCKRSASK